MICTFLLCCRKFRAAGKLTQADIAAVSSKLPAILSVDDALEAEPDSTLPGIELEDEETAGDSNAANSSASSASSSPAAGRKMLQDATAPAASFSQMLIPLVFHMMSYRFGSDNS